jgi:hypothetical protein
MSSRQVVEKILQRMDYPDPHPSDWNTPLSREQGNWIADACGREGQKGLTLSGDLGCIAWKVSISKNGSGTSRVRTKACA